MATTTFTFNRNNFTSDSPSWGASDEYSSGLRFNTVTKTLKLDNTNYGRGVFTISIPTGIDFGSIYFNTSNGSILSISDEIDGIYELCNFEGTTISKIFTQNGSPNSGTKTFYVVYNGDPDKVSQYLNVSIALAKERSIPDSNKSITLTYTCLQSSIYEYTVGVHAYSAYDAKASSSTLTTKLYSATPIGSWGIGTSIYSSPYLNNPALPYFYGYNGKVYRVGDPWSRSYGIKFRYEVRVYWKGFWPKKKTRTSRVTLGPMETLDLGTDGNQPTSEACIEPTMRNVGKIRKIYNDDSTIPQPQQYRYYMGYDATSQRNSNDSVFTAYSLPKKKHFPITGLMHVLQKHTRGIINGFNRSWDGDVNWTAIAGGAGLGLIASLFGESIISGVANFFSTIPGPLPSFTALFGTGAAAALSTVLIVLAVLFILWKLISFFSPKTHHYKENCKQFLHHFSTTPYINTGTPLYRDDDLSVINNGYYCDGVYYYRQLSNSITSKTLSSTNAFVSEDEPSKFLYSLPVDNPTLVVDWQKLILLPYMSGKPLPYCGGSTVYYSAARTHTVTTTCCALEDCSEDIVISLPYGAATSCISQTDADNEAETQFQAAIDYAEDHSIYRGSIIDEYIGTFDVDFTHEIKEEDNPMRLTLFWDNRSGSDAPVGTPLYYDFTGCQKALPGYYAVSSSNYPKHYYKVEDGEVSAIYTQSVASSTTTTTGQSIIKTNEDKTSNWFLKSNLKYPLYAYINNTNDRTFDVNSLFTTSEYTLSAGYILSGSYTGDTFKKYNTFTSNGVTTTATTEQGTGWYAPLNPWKPEDEDLFFYQNSLTSFTGGTRYTTSGSAICAGSNTGNTYYHDGESASPGLGDKIYDTNDIDDPTADGFIKYTSDLYMEIEEGVMIDSISCTPSTDFSGSIILDMGNACTASFNAVNYEYNGNTASPEIGDTISRVDSTNVTAGFIRTSTNIYQIDANGVVLQISTCSDLGSWPTDLTVGFNAILNGGNSVWYGYETYDYPTTGIGTGAEYGDIDHKFPYENSLRGYIGWKAVSLVWSSDYNQLEFTMQYPDTSGYGSSVPTAWDILEIEESGGTIHTYNVSSATSTNFTDSGKKYYRWTWSENSNPFGSYDTIASVDVYSDIM